MNVNRQHIIFPAQLAGADSELISRTMNCISASLSHRPIFFSRGIKRHINSAKVFSLSGDIFIGPGVIGGEDAANKSNDAKSVEPIIAKAIYVPPKIVSWIYCLVKPR
jgi:hypothetical protein